jgi:hypothetical protein
MDQPELWKKVKMNKTMALVASRQPEMGLERCRSIKSDGVLDEVTDPGGRCCFLSVLVPWRCGGDVKSLFAWYLVLGVWMLFGTVFCFHVMKMDPRSL